jgi:crotonobetainyl-CoA:carnitine CoA-transferase CaiB-like acyl-CoA transferase
MGVPDLPADPRFQANRVRIEHRAALNEILMPIFRSRPKREWIDAIGGAGVPCGPVNELDEVFAEEQLKAREMVVPMPHPQRSQMPLIANPIRMSDTPVQYRLRPPALGEHTNEVLGDLLGYGEEQLAQLRAHDTI